ncbi:MULTISPECIES: NAD(P)-dependent oxidoreductase [Nonomuraea]|uniref:NAD(P)-dependent oxidoreductase n=1 Tax=Nonomuraea mangrovi TaxID=2316207 RepID=A0ABW4T7M7_9ACTN
MVFGATGGTGRQVVEQAVTAGHDVTVLARDPARVSARDQVTVIGGDVLTPETWHVAVAGQEAVLSCLGSTDRRHPTTVYSAGTANILAAMRDGGVSRLLCLSSAGLEIAPGTPLGQRLVTRYVIQRLYRHGYADMTRMERVVAAARDLYWTIVRAPMLTDGPVTGDYRTAENAHLAKARSISRADLAHYLLTHVADEASRHAVVEISG